jgi:hypothetical protein
MLLPYAFKDGEERTAGSDPRIRFSSLYFKYTSYFHLIYSLLNGLGGSSVCFGSIETSKLSVSVQKRNNRNKRFVSDSAETSFGSSFGCFESKPVSKDTLGRGTALAGLKVK